GLGTATGARLELIVMRGESLMLTRARTPWVMTALLAVCFGATPGGAVAQGAPNAQQVVARAAEALGGVERISAVRTLRLRGYGQDTYQDGGSKITTEPTAPEKMTVINAYERV